MYLDYYHLCFDDQGCPMKQIGDHHVFHPILAAYLIFDLVRVYEDTSDSQCLLGAKSIALQALKHAADWQDALVFYYKEGSGLSSVPGKFYSALTQSWYVRAFCRLSRHTSDFSLVIQSLFRSLLVLKAQGGVLIEKPFGWIVEEYPHDPPFYTLNGWLTALRWIIESTDDLKRCGVAPNEFLQRNIGAVATLLPLYNAEFCRNSRYQLTGFSRVQIIADREADLKINYFAVEIPGEGLFTGALEPQHSRWMNYLERTEGRLNQLNIVLSLISAPKPNSLHLSLSCTKPCNVKLRLAKGQYRPDSTGMPTERWDLFAQIAIDKSDHHRLRIEIPYDAENMFAYPTNFKKKIGGKFYNGYHFIHIIDCVELFRFTRLPIFREYALKFLASCERWHELELPETYAITPHLDYSDGFSHYVTTILEKQDSD